MVLYEMYACIFFFGTRGAQLHKIVHDVRFAVGCSRYLVHGAFLHAIQRDGIDGKGAIW